MAVSYDLISKNENFVTDLFRKMMYNGGTRNLFHSLIISSPNPFQCDRARFVSKSNLVHRLFLRNCFRCPINYAICKWLYQHDLIPKNENFVTDLFRKTMCIGGTCSTDPSAELVPFIPYPAQFDSSVTEHGLYLNPTLYIASSGGIIFGVQ